MNFNIFLTDYNLLLMFYHVILQRNKEKAHFIAAGSLNRLMP
jgi:hypothetical protein